MTDTPNTRWPFLTHITYLDKEYVGIVQNADNQFVHMYVIEQNWSLNVKTEFLNCGDTYWWHSNRLTPINVFLGDRFKWFRSSLKTFIRKEVTWVSGPMPSLDTLMHKRGKKRTVQLVRTDQSGS
jgi:hypothetical protein